VTQFLTCAVTQATPAAAGIIGWGHNRLGERPPSLLPHDVWSLCSSDAKIAVIGQLCGFILNTVIGKVGTLSTHLI